MDPLIAMALLGAGGVTAVVASVLLALWFWRKRML